VYP
jgi:hypothetical protein